LTCSLPGSLGEDAIWLRFLRDLAIRSVLRTTVPTRRVLVGLPTSELGTAALVGAAVWALAHHRRANPLDWASSEDVGRLASTLIDGRYADTELLEVTDSFVRIGLKKETVFGDIVRPLPHGFPADRPTRKFTDTRLRAWESVGEKTDARRLHARVSATPVVAITQRSALEGDLATLELVWPGIRDLLDPGVGLERWFRHPLLICGPTTPWPDWVDAVGPALVVCDGPAAWRSPLRRCFPDAPHLLVLDRSSPAAVDECDELVSTRVETAQTLEEPPPGIETWRIIEEATPPTSDDDDEDLF
jgi:hypothetical protein